MTLVLRGGSLNSMRITATAFTVSLTVSYEVMGGALTIGTVECPRICAQNPSGKCACLDAGKQLVDINLENSCECLL